MGRPFTAPRRRRVAVASLATSLVATALLLVVSAAPATAAAFTARGSINQVYTYGHPAGSTVELLGSGGAVLASGAADAQGAKLFRDLPAGTGYAVREGGVTSSALTVTDPADNPPQSFYQSAPALSEGFGYITTRDGTTLSANVTFPNDGSTGPWPVVVDYSGYDPSQPNTTPSEAGLYPYLGYVVVGVNMRGTTCSGGAFWFFEDAQRTDGYDIIETLANQSWSNGNVGMVGISYSGYSQLYVAATQPPHLRAITPLSPFSDGYAGILYPGGIRNEGFALDWALERQADAKPSAHTWVKNRISGGDTTCKNNQVMRLQSQDISGEIIDGRFNEEKYRYLDPRSFAPQIRVPTYLSTMWQDEQTGGYGAELATMIAPNARLRASFTNGTHVDSLGPEVFMKVAEFVDLYVGQRLPSKEGNGFYQQGVADALTDLFGTPITTVPYYFPVFSTYAEGRAWYEAQDPIQIRWENGGVVGKEGKPYSTITTSYPAWPIPTAKAERWYLQPDATLSKTAPTVADGERRGYDAYTYDAGSKRASTFDGSTSAMWAPHPDVQWVAPARFGKPSTYSLVYDTPAFTGKTAYAGSGSADLWLRSTAADTDLEVSLTEVRADGSEVYIQSGWLRASRRALDESTSTVLRPRHTFQAADATPLPGGEFVPVRVEIFPFAHIFRAGSKLRVNIEAPGGNQPFWAYSALAGTATNDIAHSAGRPSSIVLSSVSDGRINFYAPSAPPSCAVPGVTTQSQSLRNQPCRTVLQPGTVTGVTAALQGNRAVVSWNAAPPTQNGVALAGYAVVPDSGPTVQVDPGQTSTTIDLGADPGPRTFKVISKYGLVPNGSPDSSYSLAVTVPTPTQVTAKPGDGTATVSWKAPTGLAPTSYVVTPSIDGVAQAPQSFASTATTQTLTGLANGTTYTFSVAARWDTTGPPSPASAPLAVGAPIAPSFITATPASQQVTLKWWAPAANGSPITGYVITPFIGGVAQAPRNFSGSSNTQVVTGLTNGVTYTFQIAAVNARGTGPAGTSPAALVNPTPPSAPTSVSAKTGDGSAIVAWKAPTANGGSAITGYRVTPSIGGVAQAPQTFASTATTQTLIGLANGSAHTFTVEALNAVGPSPASAPSAAITIGVPGTPGFITATPANQQVTLKWWAPAANGSPITAYVITPFIGGVAQAPRNFSGSSNTQVVTGLTNGVTYTFQIAAVNARGTGPAGTSPAALVNATVASAPTAVTAKSGNASAVVTWRAPASDGGAAIAGYRVTPYLGGVAQTPQAFLSTATTQTVIGLANGSAYTFTVVALNAIGPSAESAASSPLTVGTPGTPGFFTTTAGDGKVTLKWWAPAANGSPITGYVITPYIGTTAQTPVLFGNSSNTQVVTGLINGTAYSFTVAAVNAFGTGASGRTGLVTPAP